MGQVEAVTIEVCISLYAPEDSSEVGSRNELLARQCLIGDPFGKGPPPGAVCGCLPFVKASKDHCTHRSTGLHVSFAVHDFGQEDSKRWVSVLENTEAKTPPQDQTIKESLD